jgi:hypothetical protein
MWQRAAVVAEAARTAAPMASRIRSRIVAARRVREVARGVRRARVTHGMCGGDRFQQQLEQLEMFWVSVGSARAIVRRGLASSSPSLQGSMFLQASGGGEGSGGSNGGGSATTTEMGSYSPAAAARA